MTVLRVLFEINARGGAKFLAKRRGGRGGNSPPQTPIAAAGSATVHDLTKCSTMFCFDEVLGYRKHVHVIYFNDIWIST